MNYYGGFSPQYGGTYQPQQNMYGNSRMDFLQQTQQAVQQPQQSIAPGGAQARIVSCREEAVASQIMHNGMHGYDRDMHDRRGGVDGRREHMRGDYDDDEPRHHGKGRESWSDREMIATGSAWINPGRNGHDREYQPVDERQAMEWVHSMQQPDGGRPMPAYKPDEAEALRKAHCPECDRWEFFVTLNMKYSDLYEYAKKLNMDKPEFYVYMAKAFLTDKDAGPHKLQKYMEIIPK